jgi:predicted nuclease of predicted toxin-antitoxin system
MKILVDMSLSPYWVPFLVDHGFEAVHWSQIGRASAPDREIFEYASKNKFVVFTHDLDFGTLLAAQRTNSPSVLQIRSQDILPASIGALVLRAIVATYSQLQAGALVTIDPARHRIRLLPI